MRLLSIPYIESGSRRTTIVSSCRDGYRLMLGYILPRSAENGFPYSARVRNERVTSVVYIRTLYLGCCRCAAAAVLLLCCCCCCCCCYCCFCWCCGCCCCSDFFFLLPLCCTWYIFIDINYFCPDSCSVFALLDVGKLDFGTSLCARYASRPRMGAYESRTTCVV